MTAEIAIVNRSAITLAADSAMTMSVGGRRKIYASTDKIFELSESDAVAIMIYNNLEFMGAPIDVLIKLFRSSSHCCAFSTTKDCAPAFFQFLSREWMASTDLQRRHAKQILTPIYHEIWQQFSKTLRGFATKSKAKPLPFLLSLVEKSVEVYENLPVTECFSDVPEEEIEEFYRDTLDEVIARVFGKPPFEETDLALCRRLGVLALHRDAFSDMLTGFVFAGFGSSETFPSLFAYHTDGIIAGRLKTKLVEDVATSRDQISARVIPFAQREVVDRFLTGIDPDLEEGLIQYLVEIFDQTKKGLFDGTSRIGAKVRMTVLDNLEKSLGTAVRDFGPQWLEKVKAAYSQETEDMVLFMPKPESAHLAEALVNITSLKRKYSPDEESVAGPIDVAVISRSEGFVWIKRKHYFPAELNQRFLARKYGRRNGS